LSCCRLKQAEGTDSSRQLRVVIKEQLCSKRASDIAEVELEREKTLKFFYRGIAELQRQNKFPAKRRKKIMEKISQVKFGKLNAVVETFYLLGVF
jgi:hypothetical protein